MYPLLLWHSWHSTESLIRTLAPGLSFPKMFHPPIHSPNQAEILSWGPCSSLGRWKEAVAKGLCTRLCSPGLALTSLDLPLLLPSQLLSNQRCWESGSSL